MYILCLSCRFLNRMSRYKKKGERNRIQILLNGSCVSIGTMGLEWMGAVEFRNESWGVSEVSEWLPSRGFCGILVSSPLD
jgi:hypothetical protein